MGMIDKIIIPAAGLGQRLLTATKELPKEMLPVFSLDCQGNLCIKPLFEQIFNQCFHAGFRKYCFIVGKQKRAIEDHFTVDSFGTKVYDKKHPLHNDLKNFYHHIMHSHISWMNQLGNRGFGDAVLTAENFVGNDNFVLEAGDTIILSKNTLPLIKIRDANLVGKYDATFLLKQVDDPRRYGVATIKEKNGELLVKKVVEKPRKPESNFAIMPIYQFRPSLFSMIKSLPKNNKEIQVTDAIQKLIDKGGKITGVLLKKTDVVIDLGTPESFWVAQKMSYKYNALMPR